jgi:hypothetical protein
MPAHVPPFKMQGKKMQEKYYQKFLLTAHWLELYHMTVLEPITAAGTKSIMTVKLIRINPEAGRFLSEKRINIEKETSSVSYILVLEKLSSHLISEGLSHVRSHS